MNDWRPDYVRDPRMAFYLVQRLKRSPYQRHHEAFPDAKVKSNPFGYGRMGDYELDYMGSAEFEFGAVPAANNRLAEAGKDLALARYLHEGRMLDVLYIGSEGEPFDAFEAWAHPMDGRLRPYDGKERPYDFEKMLTEPDYEYGSHIWWALNANVMWAFAGDGDGEGHLIQMLGSMNAETTEFLR